MSEKFKLSRLIPELDTPFVFNRRPISLAPDLRPEWRIGVIVLLLRICCKQNRSSYGRLHLLSWAVRTKATRKAFLEAMRGSIQPDTLVVRIEPALNRAVNIALAEGILKHIKGEKIELAAKGVELADAMLADEVLFDEEKQFLADIRADVTEGKVNQIFKVTIG